MTSLNVNLVNGHKAIGANEMNEYFYIHKVASNNKILGFTSSLSFTSDRSRWMRFSLTEADRMAKQRIRPYGASKSGTFVDTLERLS
ncbi:MAG: hypothetical protein NUV80_05720 [Candidatus Berkelbacteria bacterium]|nr:hypothetical protein [Candidatus Berkelbacteria bacterium]